VGWQEFEREARQRMERELGLSLPDGGIDINGKCKRFDLVNVEHKLVGDVKFYKNTAGGNIPSAKRSTLNEYVWFLQKLPKDWSKFIVIGEDLSMAQKYVDDFSPWLDDVSIIFFERPDKLIYLRRASALQGRQIPYGGGR